MLCVLLYVLLSVIEVTKSVFCNVLTLDKVDKIIKKANVHEN